MTKVQIHFDLVRPLDDGFEPLSRAHSVFGIFSVKPDAGQAVTVEYDASRLSAPEVHAALIKAGVPVSPTIA